MTDLGPDLTTCNLERQSCSQKHQLDVSAQQKAHFVLLSGLGGADRSSKKEQLFVRLLLVNTQKHCSEHVTSARPLNVYGRSSGWWSRPQSGTPQALPHLQAASAADLTEALESDLCRLRQQETPKA